MFNKEQVNSIIDAMGLGDFSQATIRDIQALSRVIEEKTGEEVIHLEMGVPGLQPSDATSTPMNAFTKSEAAFLMRGMPPLGG